MRADIAKVIVERPRFRGSMYGGNRRAANDDMDSLPSKEGMRAPHVRKWSGKEFNDYLAPVRRFIEGTVGRRWNDVFSEICEHLGGGSTTQEHVLGHIDQYIAINVIRCKLSESNTGLVYHNALSRGRGYRGSVHHGQLYVDPDDGIIKRAKLRVHTTKSERPKTFYTVDQNHTAVKVGGIWYMVTLKPCSIDHGYKEIETPDGKKRYQYYENYICDGRSVAYIPDILGNYGYLCYNGHGGDSRSIAERYGRPNVYGVSKKQMDSKALRQYGLVNGM